MVSARSTDSNGLAARPSARPATRRACRAPVPRRRSGGVDSSARRESLRAQGRVGHGQRLVERQRPSAVEHRAQRRGDPVADVVGAAGPPSAGRRPTSWPGRRWRLRRTVTQACSGTVFTFQPWWTAALRCDNVALRDWLTLQVLGRGRQDVAAAGGAHDHALGRARRMRRAGCTARSSRHVVTPPRSRTVSATSSPPVSSARTPTWWRERAAPDPSSTGPGVSPTCSRAAGPERACSPAPGCRARHPTACQRAHRPGVPQPRARRRRPRHTRAGERHPAAVGDRPVVGR